MSLMGRTAKQHARAGDPVEGKLRNMVRRFVVTVGRGAVWKLLGIRGLDGQDEPVTAEVFHGIGIAARPATNGSPEAIVVNVGGAKVPVIVSTRDQKTLAAVLAEMGELEAGSTLVHTEASIIYARPNGTVEIRTPGGTAVPLATKADLDALAAYVDEDLAIPVVGGGGGTAGPGATSSAPAAAGTTVLKGE